MFTRRNLIKWAGTASLASALPSCSKNLPLAKDQIPNLQFPQTPAFGLATSLFEEYNYETQVEGAIPLELQGTLYRNGPGIFERDGYRKQTILDGDGMIQAFHIQNGKARFQNRFVRTEKYKEESEKGQFVYASWTTQAPGGMLSNLFGSSMKNDAGVTVYRQNDKLFAFSESTHPYELDPQTLETIGENDLGHSEGVYQAHSKIDAQSGEWIHFGLQYGRNITLHFTIFHKNGQLKKHWTLPSPDYVYMHDFFVTEKHIILNLHPADIGIFDFLSGQKSFAASFQWNSQKGNTVLVLDREGTSAPLQLQTEAAYMWHSLNAYDKGGEIVADFVGYDNPDHFIGPDPALWAIMSGRQGQADFPGTIRRYIINPQRKTIQQEVLDSDSHEFPFVNQNLSCHPHRYGYFATGKSNAVLLSGVSRVDMHTGKSASYDFGKGHFCGEPVFAPKPGYHYSAHKKEELGWILTEVYSAPTKKSFLAIFDTEHLTDGPIALLHLKHYVPLSFHGNWYSA